MFRRLAVLLFALALVTPGVALATPNEGGEAFPTETATPGPPAPTTTTLDTAPNPSEAGSSVTMTATVSPSAATGIVTFTDVTGGGSVVLGSSALVAGSAAVAVTFDTPGKRQIVASYEGAVEFDPSSSSEVTQTVAAASLTPTATTVAAVPNPVLAGSATTLTATVTPIPTTGGIEWWIDGAKATTSPVGADGKASVNRTWADPGSHTVQARFVEGTLYTGSESSVIDVTVSPVAYLVTLTATPMMVASGTTTHLAATVSPATAGSVRFYAGGSLLGTQPIEAGAQATWDPTVPLGSTLYRADFIPTGATSAGGSASVTVQGKAPVTLDLAVDPSAVVSNEGTVTFSIWASDYEASGTVEIWDVTATPAKVATGTLAEGWATIVTRLSGAGSHAYEARFVGSSTHLPATSNQVSVDLAPDTAVNVAGLGLQFGTFYPVKDGYKDTVAIKGTPGEPVTVSIKIRNSSGKTVRSWSLTKRDTAWSVAWNGRNAGGTMQAAGKYKVTQTINDVSGHTKSWTGYVVLSKKTLYWTSGSITKYANSGEVIGLNATGYAGYAASRDYYRGYILYADGCEYDWDYGEEICDVVIVKHRFVLPSAVKYASIRMAASGRAYSGYGEGVVTILGTNDDFHGARDLDHGWAWYGTGTVGADGNVSSSGAVRGLVGVSGYNNGAIVYQKVKLTFKYARLR